MTSYYKIILPHYSWDNTLVSQLVRLLSIYFTVSRLTVPWYHCGAHLQYQTPPVQPPSCGSAAGFGASGLWTESGPVPPNSAPLHPKQPGTTNVQIPQITNAREHMNIFSSTGNVLNIILQCFHVFVFSTSKRALTGGNSLSSSADMSSR